MEGEYWLIFGILAERKTGCKSLLVNLMSAQTTCTNHYSPTPPAAVAGQGEDLALLTEVAATFVSIWKQHARSPRLATPLLATGDVLFTQVSTFAAMLLSNLSFQTCRSVLNLLASTGGALRGQGQGSSLRRIRRNHK